MILVKHDRAFIPCFVWSSLLWSHGTPSVTRRNTLLGEWTWEGQLTCRKVSSPRIAPVPLIVVFTDFLVKIFFKKHFTPSLFIPLMAPPHHVFCPGTHCLWDSVVDLRSNDFQSKQDVELGKLFISRIHQSWIMVGIMVRIMVRMHWNVKKKSCVGWGTSPHNRRSSWETKSLQ